MTLSFVKTQLKKTRELVLNKDFVGAKEVATKILEYEPDNYTAHVFLGLALLELGEVDRSEQIYRKAIDSNPAQLLSWQGLAKLYERSQKWDLYAETLENMLEIYNESGEANKCAETLHKLIGLRKERGTRLQIVDALALALPDSSIYGVLSILPVPDLTNPSDDSIFNIQCAVHNSLPVLEEIVLLIETAENDTLNKEVEKRRTRLGAPNHEQLKKDVGQEIWSSSQLPKFYNEILINPITSDELRRETEHKLLRFKRSLLQAVPTSTEFQPQKIVLAREVDEMIEGIVLLKIANEFAWTLFIQDKDCELVADYGIAHLMLYAKMFPSTAMSNLLKYYFQYKSLSMFEDSDEEEENEEKTDSQDDAVDSIIAAYAHAVDNILANRIMAEVNLDIADYDNAIKAAERGLECLREEETNIGRNLDKTRGGFQVILATSWVHHLPPKNHKRALLIIDEILARSPSNTDCLMGRGYVMQGERKWIDAIDAFQQVCSISSDIQRLEAQEECAWCYFEMSQLDTALTGLCAVLEEYEVMEEVPMNIARCLWRIGSCYWAMGDVHREEAYAFFIKALKHDSAFARAFTSLGKYYLECAIPPQPVRASKCFQKAFELDARETYAAECLAEGFAEEGEWDLVEVVARRTIDGEGNIDTKGDGAAADRFPCTNAWAWKAVAVVELNRANYYLAIEACQVALRSTPDDQSLWVRLGDAYAKSGKHVAAVKALTRALDLMPNDWVCSYLIGDVKYQMGMHGEAITIFEEILHEHEEEAGVRASLGRAWLAQALVELDTGYYVRVESSCLQAARVGLEMVVRDAGFRGVAWKIVADAVFTVSQRATFIAEEDVAKVLEEVMRSLSGRRSERIPEAIRVPTELEKEGANGRKALEVALFAYDHIVGLGSSVKGAIGSAWYDLGVALDTWIARIPEGVDVGRVKEQVVESYKQALIEDVGNETYWIALGNAQFLADAKKAQHAYIMAIEIDSKSVNAWTSLGLLYFHYGDLELANEALYRAQIIDADYALAWVGQSLVATANGHNADATSILEHSITLSAPVPEADYEYARRAFAASSIGARDDSEALLPVYFALERYCMRRPGDAAGLHLFALVCERMGHLERALELVTRAITILECAYEEMEDVAVERQYVVANVTKGRVELAMSLEEGGEEKRGDAAAALESALGLLYGTEGKELDMDAETAVLRSQALFGLGIASFRNGDVPMAVERLEKAMQAAEDERVRGHVIVLLSQMLWAVATNDSKESARTLLLECIAEDPGNLAAINALAAIGIVSEDDNLVDAALSEIVSLPLEKRRKMDPQRYVEYLMIQHHLCKKNTHEAQTVAQSWLFADPSDVDARTTVATLFLQAGDASAALAVLAGVAASKEERDATPLRLRAIACAHLPQANSKHALRDAQRAVMRAPGDMRNWMAFKYVRAACTDAD